jgi:UDP-N-acetylglucosamine 2-epimerase (non-hydrolysing)
MIRHHESVSVLRAPRARALRRNRSEAAEQQTVLIVFGTRPEAIKLAPLVHELARQPWCRPITVATAQHREMLDQALRLFRIRPDHDLDLARAGHTLSEVSARVLTAIDPVLTEEEPALVIVQGDTTTTMSAALAAFHRDVPIAHVEAGLRTYDRGSPFPEELNRQLTTRLASLHLAATASAASNLYAEGVDPRSVHVTGNTVIDALQWVTARPIRLGASELANALARVDGKRLVLVTAHRRESWGQPMIEIGRALADIARAYPDVHILFPIHRNPIVRDAVLPAVVGQRNIHVVEPLGYEAFCAAMARAHIIVTDSGGVQEEAAGLGVPVLVLRDTTERQEALDAGTARLVGTDRDTIVRNVAQLLDTNEEWQRMATAVNPFGDGRASERIAAGCAEYLGVGTRLPDFTPRVPVATGS